MNEDSKVISYAKFILHRAILVTSVVRYVCKVKSGTS